MSVGEPLGPNHVFVATIGVSHGLSEERLVQSYYCEADIEGPENWGC